jgi:hypothetical protein
MSEIQFSIRNKPIGYFVGGKFGRVVLCPVCGQPAADSGSVRYATGKEHRNFIHSFTLFLDKKHNPDVTWSDFCSWEGG